MNWAELLRGNITANTRYLERYHIWGDSCKDWLIQIYLSCKDSWTSRAGEYKKLTGQQNLSPKTREHLSSYVL